jgi:DNA-binding beta-propeller fold protein YncE
MVVQEVGVRHRPSVVLSLLAFGAGVAGAADIPITGQKLIVLDKTLAGKAKVVFVAKDPAITKGAGTDPAQMVATLGVKFDSQSGAFALGPDHWINNSASVAKYVNVWAPSEGVVKKGVLAPGSLVKVVAKGLGDTALDVSVAPTGAVYVSETIVNGGEETRLCTQFTGCALQAIAGGTGLKLACNATGSSPDPSCAAAVTLPYCVFDFAFGSLGSGDGQFISPTDVMIDPSGDVYVADGNNHRIQKFDGSGAFLTKWGSSGSGDGEFSAPIKLASDASGNVYVADSVNDRIQKFDGSGAFLTKWGTAGSGDGQFEGPTGVAVDAGGNVYVVDKGYDRVQKFDATGTFLTKWGVGFFPEDVATDTAGHVFVVRDFRMQKFDATGTLITGWGVLGGAHGQLSYAKGVGTDATDGVYVADTGNHRIQKFTCLD